MSFVRNDLKLNFHAGIFKRVTDNGSPNLSDTKSFTVIVNEVNTAPVLTVPPTQTFDELTPLVVTNFAGTSRSSVNALTFSLASAPSDMTINPTNGIINWTPTEAQGPAVYSVKVRVTDNGSPNLSTTDNFVCVVREVNTAPVLTVPVDQIVPAGIGLSLDNFASDADFPANTLTFNLVAAPPGMTINSANGAIVWSPTFAQRPSTNVVTVRVRDNGNPVLDDVKSFVVIASDSTDSTRPTVQIISPVPNSMTNSALITIRGAAWDDRQLAQVLYSLNNAAFAVATGTTNWSVDAVLTLGTNTLTVKSVDAAGNQSAPVTIKFSLNVRSTLTVRIVGGGTLTPSLNGQPLDLGSVYSMTATPAKNFFFDSWSGDVASSAAKLTFTMQSNLVLQANFITNKFVGAAGSYSGLFGDAAGVAHESAGFFKLTLNSRQSFSGKVSVGGGTYSMSGTFNRTGQAHTVFSRAGKNSVAVDLHLDLDNGTKQITGTVSNADWSAELLGDCAVFNATLNPATRFAGSYTMIIPGGVNSSSPSGNGYGVVTVAPNGSVKVSGAAGDGAPLSQAVSVSKNGDWPLYVPLYPGTLVYSNGLIPMTTGEFKGAIIGWLSFSSSTARTLNGTVCSLKKSRATNVICSDGFTNETEVVGSAYQPPSTGSRAVAIENGIVILTDGNLNQGSTNAFSLSTGNSFTVAQPNARLLKLQLTPKTGLLKGTFVHPDNSNKITAVTGVILQQQKMGAGFFVGTNQTGSILLEGY